jgi:RNA polymerase sigma-70 factor (ECF subfamily)
MQADVGDGTLVLAARSGDKGAFAALLERHRSVLIALCRRSLGDPELAAEAAQEAALQALLNLDRLRGVDRFGPWLAGIGLNVCRWRLRERARDCWSWEAMQGGRLVREPIDWQAGPEELAEAADLAARVRHAVAELPRGQRAAVLLFYLSGLTHAETAAQLGIEVGAVKTRLHKARAALKRQLWKVWKEDEMATQGEGRLVEMRVADVRRKPAEGDTPLKHIVVLEEVGGPRDLFIWVGQFEGTSIAFQLEKFQPKRPLTYAFTASVLEASGGRLREVQINRLAEETFYAIAVVEGPGGTRTIDARPSDALSLALTTGAPIRVEPAVLATAAAERPRESEEYRERREEMAGPAAIVAEAEGQWCKAGTLGKTAASSQPGSAATQQAQG